MAEVENAIGLRKIELVIDNLKDDVKRVVSELRVIGADSSKVHVQYSEQFRRIEDNINERFRLFDQEIAHLKTVTYPEYWEMRVQEVIDKVYTFENRLTEMENRQKRDRENGFFEVVTSAEAVQFVKMSGVTLKELVDEIGMDMSSVSRLLNGERKNDNPVACQKIKMYCLDKMAQAK